MKTRQTDEPIDDGLPLPRRYLAIFAMSAGTALAVIDGTIANVALPTIASTLHVTASQVANVVTLYQLILIMTLLPLSALGDVIGHKRLYQYGQMIFVLATLSCFLANSLTILLLARALQALGAAGTLSVSSALIRSIYPARQLGRGLGINSMIVAGAGAFAPALGGILLVVVDWQWVFVVAAPFALISLAAGSVALPETKSLTSSNYDFVGALLSAATFALLIWGLQGLAYGRQILLGVLLLAAGIVTTVIFVRQQFFACRPILPLDLLRQKLLVSPITGLLLAFMAQMMMLVSLPFRLQHHFGFTPTAVGATLSFWPLTLIIVSPVAGALSDRALLQTLMRLPRLGPWIGKVGCDGRFQRAAFYRRGHPMGGPLVLPVRHQLPRSRGNAGGTWHRCRSHDHLSLGAALCAGDGEAVALVLAARL